MIRLENVNKEFAGGSNAVRNLTLEIRGGETCVLIGPSGCGKTTTLRMINRLIDPDSGRILIDGEDTSAIDPAKLRLKMGYVIQSTGLFPHMTVGENVGTVPRLWDWDRARIKARVDELMELVGLDPKEYRDRYPHQLSGGQRQRVGFARALGADPPILLMDEPFGAVDRITRERLQQEFIRIQRAVRKTVVFVTHDIDEAVMVGDRICLLQMQAQIAQYDTPDAILTRPASDYVAEFLGRERLVRRMSVVHIDAQTLEHPPSGAASGEPRVSLTSTLTEAFAAALSSPTERAAVFDSERYVGTFTATSLLESLRRAGADGGGRLPQEFDVVCLGGGVAGEAIAAGLKGSGLTLAVIERELVGGECAYWGCVPSKTLLRSGETLTEADRARALAASRVDWELDFPKISKRVLWMARDLDDTRPAAALEATGAKLVRGHGRLVDQRTVEVGGERFVARQSLVIANGSTAAIPPISGLDTVDYWTNRQAAVPRELPISLAILGGGAIGVELGQAFARFGCKVSIVEAGPRFLGLEEPEAGAALRPHLEADGIGLSIGDPCVGVEKTDSGVLVKLKSGASVAAERLLVATGRRANFEAWDAAGLAKTERNWLKVDPSTLEATSGVYGAGDVTGIGGFTHLAYYHGQIVARRLRGEDARADHTAVPRVTFTDPEIASVGLSEAGARDKGIDVVVAAADPAEAARGYIHDFHGGMLKLIGDRKRGVLVGATIVSPRAGEILGELVLAVKVGTPLRQLADVIHPYPAFNRMLGASLGELAGKLA